MNETLNSCISDLRAYMRLPPYDTPENIVGGDSWFKNQISKKYDAETLAQANKIVRQYNIKWQNIRKRFIQETGSEED